MIIGGGGGGGGGGVRKRWRGMDGGNWGVGGRRDKLGYLNSKEIHLPNAFTPSSNLNVSM